MGAMRRLAPRYHSCSPPLEIAATRLTGGLNAAKRINLPALGARLTNSEAMPFATVPTMRSHRLRTLWKSPDRGFFVNVVRY